MNGQAAGRAHWGWVVLVPVILAVVAFLTIELSRYGVLRMISAIIQMLYVQYMHQCRS